MLCWLLILCIIAIAFLRCGYLLIRVACIYDCTFLLIIALFIGGGLLYLCCLFGIYGLLGLLFVFVLLLLGLLIA